MPMLPDNSTGERCPKCDTGFVVRKNGGQGTWFYGCSNYPSCRYTRKGTDDASLERVPGYWLDEEYFAIMLEEKENVNGRKRKSKLGKVRSSIQ
jgi:ssDNA-binding Zn-finger/Zn-ribbon topoisomerase 1